MQLLANKVHDAFMAEVQRREIPFSGKYGEVTHTLHWHINSNDLAAVQDWIAQIQDEYEYGGAPPTGVTLGSVAGEIVDSAVGVANVFDGCPFGVADTDGSCVGADETVLSGEGCIVLCVGLSFQDGHLFFDVGSIGFGGSLSVGLSTATVEEKERNEEYGGGTPVVKGSYGIFGLESGDREGGGYYYEPSIGFGFLVRAGLGLSIPLF